ncbi:MAG: hypothetical protein M0Q23_09510 [Syntrophales bacterium]|nr:hypothetical protein [Syntrophales bacterium]MCK9528850.1 hypothetical protein [Syntrophales bacterium]MDX9921056.1 hypothetical protein [Syntrophales bacterium]
MKKDFTLSLYDYLLGTLKPDQYTFRTFKDFLATPDTKTIILRHDVDRLPDNALRMAEMEHFLGIQATYYFRVVPESWSEDVMRRIAAMGHELGYHYEDLAIAKGDYEMAIGHFERQLERFRAIYPVKTVCMHGSPLSRYDNRDLWKRYDYRDYGIIGEPYFDVNYKKIFYLTDTGRRWNNESSSIRDRVDSGFDIPVKSTFHLMELAREGKLPDRIMINVHPQRWHNRPWPWVKELVWQTVKNLVKRSLIKR